MSQPHFVLRYRNAATATRKKDMITMEDNITPRCFSVKQTAAALNVSVSSVRDLIRRGFFQPSRALRHLRIPVDQIDTFLKTTTERI